jgi:hypothetical protein
MPDASPVPDTALVVAGALTGTALSGSNSASATWAYHGWSANLSSGPTGQVTFAGFPTGSVGDDVTATFSDGFISQTASASLIDPVVTVVFEQMPLLQVLTPAPSPLDPGAATTVTVVAVDGAGDPIVGAPLTFSTSGTKSLGSTKAGYAAKLAETTSATGRVTFTIYPTATAK